MGMITCLYHHWLTQRRRDRGEEEALWMVLDLCGLCASA
jgi:hypothetical protein